ncbi:hypothetical protein [Geodermatophilus sp. URMC 64]
MSTARSGCHAGTRRRYGASAPRSAAAGAALVLGFGWTWLLWAWLLLSAKAVSVTAVAAQWATRRPGPLPGALIAAAAGIVLGGEGAPRPWYWVIGAWSGPHLVQGVVDVLTVLALILLLPRHRSTRLWPAVLYGVLA